MRFVKKEVGYLDGIMVLLLAIAGNLGVQLLAGIIVGAGQTSNYAQLVCMIIFQLVFAAVPVIYYSAKKIRPALAFPVNKPRPSLALAPLLPVISMFGFMLPALLFETLLLNNGYKPSGLEFSGAGETALAAIATIILAPCAEELIFRGFLLSGLKKEFNTYVCGGTSVRRGVFAHAHEPRANNISVFPRLRVRSRRNQERNFARADNSARGQ